MLDFFSLSDPLGSTHCFDLKYAVWDFKRISARQTARREHDREGSNVIFTLDTLNVNPRDRPYREKTTQKDLMFQVLGQEATGIVRRKYDREDCGVSHQEINGCQST